MVNKGTRMKDTLLIAMAGLIFILLTGPGKAMKPPTNIQCDNHDIQIYDTYAVWNGTKVKYLFQNYQFFMVSKLDYIIIDIQKSEYVSIHTQGKCFNYDEV